MEASSKRTTGIGDFFSADGRLNRKKYIIAKIVILALFSSLYFLSNILYNAVFNLAFLFSIPAFLYVSVCLDIKRLHDLARPGYLVFVFLIPPVNAFLLFVLLFLKGTDGFNKYGGDPLRFCCDLF